MGHSVFVLAGLALLGAAQGARLGLVARSGARLVPVVRDAVRSHVECASADGSEPPPHILIAPGFGNDMVDYVSPLGQPQSEGLCAALAQRGYSSSVLQLARGDWLRVAHGLRDWAFISGRGTPEGPAFRWYVERLRAAVDAEVERSGQKVIVLGHSAGGWLARAALGDNDWAGDGRSSDSLVRALVTLGSPHLPPPAEMRDQSFGVLRYVDQAYPAAYIDSIAYATVASSAIHGDGNAERGSVARYAHGSYAMVCGQGDVPGDGLVPTCAAHLAGALQLTLDAAVHSINEPGSAQPTSRWYGSEGVIDSWLKPVERALGLPKRGPAQATPPLDSVR